MSATAPQIDVKAWGKRVEARRKLLGMSQRELAAKVEPPTTQATIWKVEHGEIHPRDSLRLTIATALRAKPETLFPYEAA